MNTGHPARGVAIADFDQDGASDIAASGEGYVQGSTSYAFILYNLAFRQLGIESSVTVSPPLRLVANPSRNRMAVEFELHEPGHVRLEVFDLAGRRVAALVEGLLPAGTHTRTWRGETTSTGTAPPGVYVVRIATESQRRATKAVWLGK